MIIDGLEYPDQHFNSDHCPFVYLDTYNIRVYNKDNGGHYFLNRQLDSETYKEDEEVIVFCPRRNEKEGSFLKKIVDKDPMRLIIKALSQGSGNHYKFKTNVGGVYATWVTWKIINVKFY